jgi:dTDP-3-amino-3,4,6-trideoxy-alpha-D-glucose transaminase
LGDVAAFGFYPSMNLGAYGDGGAIVTDDAQLAERARMLRHGGQRKTYEHELAGTNSRLDEIQAAILRAKLVHLDRWNEQRRSLAARYGVGLGSLQDLSLPVTPAGVEHVFHLYVVRTLVRNALHDYLTGAGIGTAIHYPKPVHLQTAYASLGYQEGSCPSAEAAAAEILSLPVFPQLTDHEAEHVIRLVRIFFAMH